ncbi:hypothetical protein CB1_002705001 [Camelus ferus]|nr:hypothetical protein CB1_002705001 [Camelus ferus]
MDCSPPASAGASPSSAPGSSPTSRSRKPGAVIESFVNHAPGVFSGTFSGTLHPNCQDSSGRPRRDIGTILQILNDLLSATRHYQGMPPSLTQLRCHAQCTPASPAPDLAPKTTSCEKLAASAPASLNQARLCKPPGNARPEPASGAADLTLLEEQNRRWRRGYSLGRACLVPGRAVGASGKGSCVLVLSAPFNKRPACFTGKVGVRGFKVLQEDGCMVLAWWPVFAHP